MGAGVARPGRAVGVRLSWIKQLGWVRSVVPVACAAPLPIGE